jgi:hypothetical protein
MRVFALKMRAYADSEGVAADSDDVALIMWVSPRNGDLGCAGNEGVSADHEGVAADYQVFAPVMGVFRPAIGVLRCG